jgi:hypothetical protein
MPPRQGRGKIERIDIFVIGGDKQFADSTCGGAVPQFGHELSSNTFSLILASYGNIVDDNFGQLCSRHRQDVCGDSTDDLIASKCSNRPKIFSGKETINVAIAERFGLFVKNRRDCGKERPCQISVDRP